MKQQMTPEELAESVKRLRELDTKRAAGNWYAHDDNQKLNSCVVNDSKQGWDRVESDYTLIESNESPNLEPDDIAFIASAPAMMKTINALVDLVGEMEEALGSCKYTRTTWYNGRSETFWFDFHKVEKAQTKSAPIAALVKEGGITC